jgi:ABC-2 type transport system ATP-binding protein
MIRFESLEFAAPTDQSDAVIEARGLTRFFGHKCAVNSLSFRVPRGSVFAFIGRNGAGKTTTIRMILGLLEATRGSCTILGHDSASLSPEVRAHIGYLTEGHCVYGWMRVGQYGEFQRGFYPRWNQDIFAAVVDHFSIDPRTKAGHLSHGQRAGLHLAMTLAIEPEVLMLDDPATGLDPAARRSLLEAMVYFTRSRERTIFFSSHLLDDVERVADQVAILDYSVLRACASIETFRDRVHRLVARFPAAPPRKLPDIPGLLQMARDESELSLIVVDPTGRDPEDRLPRRLLESLGASAVEEQSVGLEELLIAYVGRHGKKSLLLNHLGGLK